MQPLDPSRKKSPAPLPPDTSPEAGSFPHELPAHANKAQAILEKIRKSEEELRKSEDALRKSEEALRKSEEALRKSEEKIYDIEKQWYSSNAHSAILSHALREAIERRNTLHQQLYTSAYTVQQLETSVEYIRDLVSTGADATAAKMFASLLGEWDFFVAIDFEAPREAILRLFTFARKAYARLGDRGVALQLQEMEYALRCKAFGPDHPEARRALSALADAYDRQGSPAKAAALREGAAEQTPEAQQAAAIGQLEQEYALMCEIWGEEHPNAQEAKAKLSAAQNPNAPE